jgi:hypothetical protein
MKKTTVLALTVLLQLTAGLTLAQTANLLSKAGQGDWVQFKVNVQNLTEPLLSVKDQSRWRVASAPGEGGVRIDNYTEFSGRKASLGGMMADLNKPFEPVPGIVKAKITIVSSAPENLTVKGKSYVCTKIVRQVRQPVDEVNLEAGWNGTSTIWVCPEIPVGGIVKIENQYESQLTAGAKPEKINESWVLVDFGFKNWTEE